MTDKILKYNYVLFNTQDGATWKDSPDGYYSICVDELKNHDGIKVVSAPMDYRNSLIRFVFSLHSSPRINKKINLPFKRHWFPYYFKNDFETTKPICFVLLNHHLPQEYLSFVKSKYPDCKIVLLHRDLLKVHHKLAPQFIDNPFVDIEMTYDKGESEKYGMPHFDEFESKIEVKKLNSTECDVFFAGSSKGRFELLLEIYKKITSMGYSCNYYLTGVPKEKRIVLPGITYADRFMPYKEMLTHTVNCNVVLEINQPGADGYTSRFLEAVMYNKKLITNNQFVKETKFYNPAYISCIAGADDIGSEFLSNDNLIVDYKYSGEFSPLHMIERVEEELVKKYG